MKKLTLSAVLAVAVLVSGCEIIDNQQIVPADKLSLANPAPTQRDFVGNNQKHKVLVAAIDTGVDYNHPLLADHMHFTLDDKGAPIGLGHDYIGNDEWPAPYVVRTSTFDPSLRAKDREDSLKNQANINKLLATAPEFSAFLDPDRNNEREVDSGSYHGTHVAGLMTYDRPEIGFLSYRVLPHNVAQGDFFGVSHDYLSDFAQRLETAMDRAAQDGARVVNISLGLSAEKGASDEPTDATYAKLAKIHDDILQIVLKHPDVLYVVAAGNDGKWEDGNIHKILPCNIDAPNVLCVAALDGNGDPASFTNIPLDRTDVVFALGEKVISTLPTKMCTDESLSILDPNITPTDLSYLAATLKKNCAKVGMGPLSGTSMASPLVAHVAAEVLLKEPRLRAAEVVQHLIAMSESSSVGVLPIHKLMIKKPSWYSNGITMSTTAKSSSGYWQMMMPKKPARR